MDLKSPPQIQLTTPSMRMNRPTVTMTAAITERCCTGRIERDLEHESEHERDRERREERLPVRQAPLDELVGDVRRRHRELALREIDDAGRAVHEDEREREAPVDGAERKTLHRQLGEDVAAQRADEEPAQARPPTRSRLMARRRGASKAITAPSTRGSCGGRSRRRGARRWRRTARRGRPRARSRRRRPARRAARSARR